MKTDLGVIADSQGTGDIHKPHLAIFRQGGENLSADLVGQAGRVGTRDISRNHDAYLFGVKPARSR